MDRTIRIVVVLAVILLSFTVFLSTAHAQGANPTNLPGNTALYALGWGSLALINAGLAQGKNRSGLGWFLISLLLGPIATFILVVFFPKTEDKPAR